MWAHPELSDEQLDVTVQRWASGWELDADVLRDEARRTRERLIEGTGFKWPGSA